MAELFNRSIVKRTYASGKSRSYGSIGNYSSGSSSTSNPTVTKTTKVSKPNKKVNEMKKKDEVVARKGRISKDSPGSNSDVEIRAATEAAVDHHTRVPTHLRLYLQQTCCTKSNHASGKKDIGEEARIRMESKYLPRSMRNEINEKYVEIMAERTGKKERNYKVQKEYERVRKQEAIDTTVILCTICLTKPKNDTNAIVLDCGHIFHRNCLRRWIAIKSTCPVCGEEVTRDIEYGEEKGKHKRWETK